MFSGAGISAESGLKTFRGNDGLWENHNIYEVATPEAWKSNPELVLRFYNERRKQLKDAKPNNAHKLLSKLEAFFEVIIITQNIDDLHERAGSTNVIHLHGELTKAKSESYPNDIIKLDKERIELGDLCQKGHQLRPHVVWFGEEVPLMEMALQTAFTADIFIVIGTSLNVYPAANIINYLNKKCLRYLIDPEVPTALNNNGWIIIKDNAVNGMEILFKKLTKKEPLNSGSK